MITETLQNSILEIIAILLITSFLVWLLTWLFTRWNWKRQLKAEQEAHQEATTVLAKTLEDKNEYVKLFEDKQEDYNGLFGDKEALEVTNQEMRQDFEVLLKEKNALFFNFKQLKADNESQSETISELLVVKNDYGVLLEDYESQQKEKNKLKAAYDAINLSVGAINESKKQVCCFWWWWGDFFVSFCIKTKRYAKYLKALNKCTIKTSV